MGQIGQESPSDSAPPQNNQDTSILGQPAQFAMDERANELYIADGYLNKRIVVSATPYSSSAVGVPMAFR